MKGSDGRRAPILCDIPGRMIVQLLSSGILMARLHVFVFPVMTRDPERKDRVPAFEGMTLHTTFLMQHSIVVSRRMLRLRSGDMCERT